MAEYPRAIGEPPPLLNDQATLREIVRTAVESYLPAGALHAAKVAERSEREAILDASAHFIGRAVPNKTAAGASHPSTRTGPGPPYCTARLPNPWGRRWGC